jgi:hypothetical protein
MHLAYALLSVGQRNGLPQTRMPRCAPKVLCTSAVNTRASPPALESTSELSAASSGSSSTSEVAALPLLLLLMPLLLLLLLQSQLLPPPQPAPLPSALLLLSCLLRLAFLAVINI